MLCLDAETTGLLDNHLLPLDKQPEIVELFACELGLDSGEIGAEFNSFFKPARPVTAETTRITGITPAMVADAPLFADKAQQLQAMIESTDCIVAHNLSYDKEMIDLEFERLGRKIKWPALLCTVEATVHLKGFRLSLTALHELLFNERFPEAHRARTDVMALVRCLIELKKRGEI
jgi:DNA polymerase III subunit epsilon